jgi:hypothetical protein
MSQPDLIPCILLDVEGIGETGKFLRAEIDIAREHEVGQISYHAYTHLGHLFAPGDTALCYDVQSNANSEIFPEESQDLIVVRKAHEK